MVVRKVSGVGAVALANMTESPAAAASSASSCMWHVSMSCSCPLLHMTAIS